MHTFLDPDLPGWVDWGENEEEQFGSKTLTFVKNLSADLKKLKEKLAHIRSSEVTRNNSPR